MVKALRSCLEAVKGRIKAGHLILRKSPKRTATGSSTASNISRSLVGLQQFNPRRDIACTQNDSAFRPIASKMAGHKAAGGPNPTSSFLQTNSFVFNQIGHPL